MFLPHTQKYFGEVMDVNQLYHNADICQNVTLHPTNRYNDLLIKNKIFLKLKNATFLLMTLTHDQRWLNMTRQSVGKMLIRSRPR